MDVCVSCEIYASCITLITCPYTLYLVPLQIDCWMGKKNWNNFLAERYPTPKPSSWHILSYQSFANCPGSTGSCRCQVPFWTVIRDKLREWICRASGYWTASFYIPNDFYLGMVCRQVDFRSTNVHQEPMGL